MQFQSLAKASYVSAFGAVVLGLYMVLASPSLAAEAVASGSFKGASGHITTGSVTIEKDGNGYRVVLGSDFTFDGAPDPKFAFANGGALDSQTIFAELKANSGRQVYKLPGSIDPSDYDQFVLWCEQFSVPLGTARLK